MQIKLDRRIEESGDRTRIELFQSAMVHTGIRYQDILDSMTSCLLTFLISCDATSW